MTTAAQHGPTWTAAIAGSVGLHASAYALLSLIEPPAPVRQPALLMAYIVPAPSLIPEPLPPPVEPDASGEIAREPPPEPEPSPPAEPEQATEVAPQTQAEAPLEDVREPSETRAAEAEGPPSLTRFEWYAEIPEAVARLRAAEEAAPTYRRFGDLDALTEEATPAWALALDPPGEGVDALDSETTAWGEERVRINEHCYQSSYAPGSVLAEVHRFSNVTINCEGGSAAEPRNDLFLEAKPDYLERD